MEQEPLAELLDEQGIRDAILFGHSDGGSIAIVNGSLPCVRGLILEAAHVFCEEISVSSILRAREAYEHGELRAGLAKYHDDVDGAFYGWNRAWLDPGFRAFNLERYLPLITAPTLIIQGADDPYGTLAQVDAIERGVRGPVERFIVPACGHAPHREHRQHVLERCARFVRAL
jgi:pimeloyl-ACP methyl ester carboxylesterase